MQIKDRDSSGELNWATVDEPLESRFSTGFRKGMGFAPSSIDEGQTLISAIEFQEEPEALDEKDRVGEDTRPRR